MDYLGILGQLFAYLVVFGIIVGFVIVTKKCFFEKYTFGNIIVPIILSPILSNFLAHLFTERMCYSNDLKESVSGFVLYSIIQIAFCLVQLLIYVKFVKAPNKSIAIFIYLCCMVFCTYNDTYETIFENTLNNRVGLINSLIILVAALFFYKMVIIPVSELTPNSQKHGMAAFVVIPVIAVLIKQIIFTLHNICDIYFLNGSQLLSVDEFNEKIDLFLPYYKDLTRNWWLNRSIYVITSHCVLIIFVISFAVIVKNILHINEINRQNIEIRKAHDDLKTLSVEVMEALAHTIDAKDKYTNGHSMRVAIYARMIAEKMGLTEEECDNIYYMGLLHDIGKIGVPNEIINKPSGLTDEEYDVIKTHPGIGFEILSEMKSHPMLAKGAHWHHERYDGKGYPDHLEGENIPIESRIIAVADSYDAMTSNRSYRKYLSQDVVRSEIEKNSGTQFDPEIVKCMLEIIDEDEKYLMHE